MNNECSRGSHPQPPSWDYMSGEQWHATQLKIHKMKASQNKPTNNFLSTKDLKLFCIYRINEILSLCMESIWILHGVKWFSKECINSQISKKDMLLHIPLCFSDPSGKNADCTKCVAMDKTII